MDPNEEQADRASSPRRGLRRSADRRQGRSVVGERTGSVSPRRGVSLVGGRTGSISPHSSPEALPYSTADTTRDRCFQHSRRGLRRRPDGGRPGTPDLMGLSLEPEVKFEPYGRSGKEIELVTNFFQVTRNVDWNLFAYRVEFEPTQDEQFVRKSLVRTKKQLIGAYIFDGQKLYTTRQVPVEEFGTPDHLSFSIANKAGPEIQMHFKYEGPAAITHPVYVQFYNLIVRKCLYGMGLEEMGRNFYDHGMAINFPALKIQLWPGYITSMQNHEAGVLLSVEVTHKVIRTESILSVIQGIQQTGRPQQVKEAVQTALQDAIVITHYNRSTYRIRAVDFNLTPMSTFTFKDGVKTSFFDYYRTKYHLEIKDLDQPLLIAKQTRYDPRQKGKEEGLVTLVPEFCLFTGLTEAMRSNFSLMKELAKHLHMSPKDRINALVGFMTRLQGCRDLMTELQEWGFAFQIDLLRCKGRVLPREKIIFAQGSSELANEQADWTSAFRSQKLFVTKSLSKWVVFITRRDSEGLDNLVRTMQKVSKPLGFIISAPQIITLNDNKIQTYVRAIDDFMSSEMSNVELIFVCLASQASDLYAAIKKRVVIDYGVPSQCFISKNMKSKGLMTIATKMCVQMCTKLGGEPWTVKIPPKNLMVIGVNTYGKKTPMISSVVASLSSSFAKYYSTVSFSNSPTEKLQNICSELTKCVKTYKAHNRNLPDWILIYRDGLETVDSSMQEIGVIEAALDEFYMNEGEDMPKFTYVLVSKKINTRLMSDRGAGRVDNVPPGTVVDRTITVPERYDFFLVSATARQGTSSPCYYNVLRDTSGMEADKMQMLTHKFCHLYFNWSGTVGVPAPCQYAAKLSGLTAVAYERVAHPDLSELLYYL